MCSLLALFFFAALLFSCKEESKKKTVIVYGKILATLQLAPESVKGTYSDNFKGSSISIVISYVSHQPAL